MTDNQGELSPYQQKAVPCAPDYVPNEREEKFLDAYIVMGMNPTRAWAYAGYSDSSVNLAYQKVKRLGPIIAKRINQKLVSHAPIALKVLSDVMEDEDVNPATRVKAATEWLDRSGFSKTVEMRITDGEKPVDEMSEEEIQQRVASLVKRHRLFGRHTSEYEVKAEDAEIVSE